MADSSKSVKVDIQVTVEQAKAALAQMAATTQKTTDALAKMGDGAKKGSDGITKATASATKATSSFFDTTTLGVLKGLASYDLLKKGITLAVGTLKDSVQAAADSEAVHAQLYAVLKSTGEAAGVTASQALNLADALKQTTAYDDDAILSAENLLLTFTNIGTNVFPQTTQAVLDMATAMHQDLQSTVIQVGKALQDPIQGATALQRVGVRLSASQQELIKTFVETNQVAKAQGVILAELNKEFGGSAASYADTFAGKLDKLKNAFGDVEKAVGKGITLALTEMLDQLNILGPNLTVNQEAMDKLTKVAYEVTNGLLFVAHGIGLVVDGLSGLVNGIAYSANKLSEWAADAEIAVLKVEKVFGKATQSQIDDLEAQKQAIVATSDVLKERLIKDSENASKNLDGLTDAWNKMNGQGLDVAIDKMNKADGAMSTLTGSTGKLGSSTSATNEQIQQATQDAQALAQAFEKVTQKQDQFTFNAATDFAKFKTLIANAKMAQDQWIAGTSQGFDALNSKIQSVNSTIDSLKQKLQDSAAAYDAFIKQTSQDSGRSFAQIVHDAEKAIPDLQKQIADAAAQGQDTSDLQKQLADKNAVIAESNKSQYTSNADFVAQLALLRKQDSENELQIAYETMQQKIQDKFDETVAANKEILKQLAAAQEQRDKLIQFQDDVTAAYAQAVKDREKSINAEVGGLAAVQAAADATAAAYDRLAASMSQARVSSAIGTTVAGSTTATTKRATGGPVIPGQSYLVGENGPEMFAPSIAGSIVPNDKVSASGGVNVTINYPTVRSDQDLRDIVSAITDALGRRDELARMGAYK